MNRGRKGSSALVILLVIVVLVIVLGVWYYGAHNGTSSPEEVNVQATNTSSTAGGTNVSGSNSQPALPAGWSSKEVYNGSNPAVCYTVQYPSELIPQTLEAPGVIWFEDPSAPGNDPNVPSDGVRIDIYPNTTIAAQSGVNADLYSPFGSAHNLYPDVTSSVFTTAGGLEGQEFLRSQSYGGEWFFYIAMPGEGSTTILMLDDPFGQQNVYDVTKVKEMASSILPTCGH